jgi:hypothetical protein
MRAAEAIHSHARLAPGIHVFTDFTIIKDADGHPQPGLGGIADAYGPLAE